MESRNDGAIQAQSDKTMGASHKDRVPVRRSILSASLLLVTVLVSRVHADTLPFPLAEVGIDQHLNEQLPLDLWFRDEAGQTVQLAQYFGRTPVILVPAYYNCPMLCPVVFEGL